MAAIALTLGKGLTKRSKKFDSYQALSNWSLKEMEFWVALQDNFKGALLADESPLTDLIEQHRRLQAQCRALSSDGVDRNKVNEIAAKIHFNSDSPEGQFFARTAWEGLAYLDLVMGALSGSVPASALSLGSRKVIAEEISSWAPKLRKRYDLHAPDLRKKGVSSEAQYFNLIEDRINRLEVLVRKKEDLSAKRDETSRQQVETLLKDIEAEAKSTRESLEKSGLLTLKNMEETFTQVQNYWADKGTSFDNNIKNVTTRLSAIDEKKAQAEAEFDNVLVALRAKLQLEEGANYWEEKAKSHDKVKICMSVALIVYAVATVVCVYLLGRNVLLEGSTLSKALTNTVSPRSIFLLGMIGVVYTVVFWGGRILTRITLGHIHLANDAKERGVVMQTYLALQSDSTVTPEERQIMLSTVFRPSTDGVVRDDAAPMNTLAAAVVKRLTP